LLVELTRCEKTNGPPHITQGNALGNQLNRFWLHDWQRTPADFDWNYRFPAPHSTQNNTMVRLTNTPAEHLFWEYSPAQRESLTAETVYARVMERGTADDYRWLVRTQSADDLRAWFVHHAARHCSERTLALWAILLECERPVSHQIPWGGND